MVMTEPYRIRRATPADAAALADISRTSFVETFVDEFAIPYHPDDLEAFLAENHSTEAFAEWLAEPGVTAWVAEAGGEAAGYALVGPVGVPHPDVAAGDLELHRLYLPRAHHGSGAGGLLMQAALDGMEDADCQWLGVWSGNIRAQRFYARHGFEKAGEYDFPVGRTLDREFILRRTANPA